MPPRIDRFRWYVLDAENRVIEATMLEWGRMFERVENRLVGMTQITSDLYVSTVFMGINHRFRDDGPPLVFETMIFGGPDEINERMWRYSSWDDAEIGHKAAVRKAREAIGQKINADE